MRIHLGSAVFVLAALSLVGCDGTNPARPSPASSPSMQAGASPASAGQADAQAASAASTTGGKPEIDPTYANGTTVYMIGPHLIVDARAKMPNAYDARGGTLPGRLSPGLRLRPREQGRSPCHRDTSRSATRASTRGCRHRSSTTIM